MQTSHYTIDLDAGTIETDQLPAGYSLRVKIENDDYCDTPWERDSGHGEIRHEWCRYGTPKLSRGETILYSDGRDHWIYNQGAAFVTAWRDGWGLSPDSLAKLTRTLGKKPTRSQIRAEAVRQDMAFLRGYLSNTWNYVGVCVTLHDAGDDEIASYSIWDIESNAGDYLLEVAAECADECMRAVGIDIETRAKNWRAALVEARMRRYWAQRDVQTVGA